MRRGQPVKRRAAKAAVRLSRAPELKFASRLGVTPALETPKREPTPISPAAWGDFLLFCRCEQDLRGVSRFVASAGGNCLSPGGKTVETRVLASMSTSN